MRIRVKVLPEIVEYIDTLNQPDDTFHPINKIANLFLEIKNLLDLNTLNPNVLNNKERKRLKFLKEYIIYEDIKCRLTIWVCLYARPIVGSQFILHILLSLSHFATEVNILLHTTIRESLQYAKLIGPSNDTEELQKYFDELLKQWILHQS